MASKKDGGLGVRDLPTFNKALLAKQAWRIIKYPNSLLAKTLRNKYHPHSSFMEVKVSPLSSFTWRFILSTRDLIKRGLKKVVGSVHEVNIWDDPWIPRLPNFRIFSHRAREDDGPQVLSDLMVE